MQRFGGRHAQRPRVAPNICLMASVSTTSPTWVAVPCALKYPTSPASSFASASARRMARIWPPASGFEMSRRRTRCRSPRARRTRAPRAARRVRLTRGRAPPRLRRARAPCGRRRTACSCARDRRGPRARARASRPTRQVALREERLGAAGHDHVRVPVSDGTIRLADARGRRRARGREVEHRAAQAMRHRDVRRRGVVHAEHDGRRTDAPSGGLEVSLIRIFDRRRAAESRAPIDAGVEQLGFAERSAASEMACDAATSANCVTRSNCADSFAGQCADASKPPGPRPATKTRFGRRSIPAIPRSAPRRDCGTAHPRCGRTAR